jgi:signal transduction histidine kinase
MPLSTAEPYAAIIAFTALGANLLGTGLLILINPRSRAVRWHAAFMFWIVAWLALQGWLALGAVSSTTLLAYLWVVHLMPTFFLADALVDTYGAPLRIVLLPIVAGLLTAGFLNPVDGRGYAIAWQVLFWGSGALVHFRHRSEARRRGGAFEAGEAALKVVLLIVVPIAVVGVILLGGVFLLYALPLLTIVIQFLIFIGVIRHRFYDIEVRAARTGEIAAQGAEQARLALLGELSATLAHEIRNPLTGMRSLTQRLARGDVDDARAARYADVILGEIGRLDRIVGNLLDLSRRSVVDTGAPAHTELRSLFEDLQLLLDGRARRAQVAIDVQAASDVVAAVPRDALAQALLNLLLNAVAHSPAGGRVRLEARPLPDGAVEIRVTDSGPGVPLDDRERIFEPFHTGGTGAGLGLAVVRRLARELDWQIGVRDGAGGGACFHLRVPGVA